MTPRSKKPDPKRGPSPAPSPISPSSSPQTPHTPQKGWAAKALTMSDKLGGKFNDYTDKWGIEAFWPTTGDFPREMEKAARILRSFTAPATEPDAPPGPAAPVRIPPSVIANARGLAIYSCFRTGWAPVGGGTGSGVVIARLPDGSWSAPAALCPTAVGAGMQIGLDVYSAVLVIRSAKALRQFGGHRVALGGELSVAAGPYGGGKGVDKGLNLDSGPEVYAYMHSRGAYFGIEVVGTVFVSRADENAAMYHWPGIKAGDILTGRVPVPPEASGLMQALRAAETGVAQSPNVAGYGPGFGGGGPSPLGSGVGTPGTGFGGMGGHGPAGPSAYERDEKPRPQAHEQSHGCADDRRSPAPSAPRPQLYPLDMRHTPAGSTGASPSRSPNRSPGGCSPGGTRFVAPRPGRTPSPLPADVKSDAPPPYSPS